MFFRSVELQDHREDHQLELLGEVPPNKILVKVMPPFSPHFYSSLTTEIHEVVLAPRYRGDVLTFSEQTEPVFVNVCIAKDRNSSLVEGPWSILDIGLLSTRPEP